MRSPGTYAVLAGKTFRANLQGSDHVNVEDSFGRWVRHRMDELDDLLSVRIAAVWRGGKISVRAVRAVRGDECGFFTSDGGLAKREGLRGDFYNGWYGAAPLSELTDVEERVASIHPRGRES